MLAGFAPLGADRFIPTRPLEGKAVFCAHGSLDERVPVQYARRTVEILEACGADVTYCESQVGHKLGADCRREMARFFAQGEA